MESWAKEKIDVFVKCVISSDIEKLEQSGCDGSMCLPDFPLCGKWRKNLTGLHLAAAYGSLTCLEYFLNKIEVNSQTADGVDRNLSGPLFIVLQQTAIHTQFLFF
jgi:hypothetical protein